MKILLIGDFSGKGDEGLSQVSKKYYDILNQDNKVINFNTKEILRIKNLVAIFGFKPQIIHYVTGITIRSLIISKFLRILMFNYPKTILSAIRVYLSSNEKKKIKYLKPDLILTQSDKWEKIFNENGIKTQYLPNPINTDKFRYSNVNKEYLKKKYGIPLNIRILLHVGHIKNNRNLDFFLKNEDLFKKLNFHVVIIGSTFHDTNIQLLSKLIKAGFTVINRFIESIEEIYQMSDIYIFPIKGLSKNYFPNNYQEIGVIDQPLSILEALCCGLPIVSTEVDSMTLLTKQYKNLPFYVYEENDINTFIHALNKAEKYSFINHNISDYLSSQVINKKLNKIYVELLNK